MNLYRNLPGYDLESRIYKTLDRGVEWFTERVENTLMVCAVLVLLAAAIHIGWHWSVK